MQQQFLAAVYAHAVPVPAADWREYAQSDEFLAALRQRLANVGIAGDKAKRLINAALADPGWRPLAALDAATRMVDTLVRADGIIRGRQAARVIARFAAHVRNEASDEAMSIPADYWSASPAPPGPEGEEQVLLRGAVLVRVRGRRAAEPTPAETEPREDAGGAAGSSPELAAALGETSSGAGRRIFGLLRADGLLTPAMLFAAGGVVIEALLLSGLFDLGNDLSLGGERFGAMGALLLFVMALLLLELPIVASMLRYGRRLETRLRMAFLEKLPRIGDRYFHSRPASDMAERSHSIHRIRQLPALAERFLRLIFELVFTTAGIIWLDPASASVAIVAAALAVGLPLMAQPVLMERDLRVRNHSGAISRFYLDALIGLVAVRIHGAERALRREHEGLLLNWAGAALGRQRAVVVLEGVQFFVGFGLAAWLLLDFVARTGEYGGLLLFIYWVLNLPALGQEIAWLAQQYPDNRNITLRLLEPLGALEEGDHQQTAAAPATEPLNKHKRRHAGESRHRVNNGSDRVPTYVGTTKVGTERIHLSVAHAPEPDHGCAIRLARVSVRAAGHTILEDIDLDIESGTHLAVVGVSGAGKSSLVGLLLGWHRAAAGEVFIDGEPLDGERLERLRRETAWVDPAVQLWNRSFLDNLGYGAGEQRSASISAVIRRADLLGVLGKLPDGLQTPLGEGGALVSGGEGQRMRLGRAMLREDARLVILDEPFRGLERAQRHLLMARVRELWPRATLICISHDIEETCAFPRVLVVDHGRLRQASVHYSKTFIPRLFSSAGVPLPGRTVGSFEACVIGTFKIVLE